MRRTVNGLMNKLSDQTKDPTVRSLKGVFDSNSSAIVTHVLKECIIAGTLFICCYREIYTHIHTHTDTHFYVLLSLVLSLCRNIICTYIALYFPRLVCANPTQIMSSLIPLYGAVVAALHCLEG